MKKFHQIKINHRQTGTIYNVEVSEEQYILQAAEEQGATLPFACRNGACTSCAVRIIHGEIYQPEAMGLSLELQRKGYALLCVSYPRSELELETQDEDEVYEQQFGKYFARGKIRLGIPLDED